MKNIYLRLLIFVVGLNFLGLGIQAYSVTEDDIVFQESGLHRYSILAQPTDNREVGVQVRLKIVGGQVVNFSQSELLTMGTCTDGNYYNPQQVCVDVVSAQGIRKGDLLGKLEVNWDDPKNIGTIQYESGAAYVSDNSSSDLNGIVFGKEAEKSLLQIEDLAKITCILGIMGLGYSATKKNSKLFLVSGAFSAMALAIIIFVKPNILPETGYPKSTALYNKKVLVIIWNPTMANGKKLTADKGYDSPTSLIQNYISWFKNVTNGRLNYSVYETREVNDFTVLEDGKKYTSQTFNECLSNNSKCYRKLGAEYMADYAKIINDFQVCDKVNNGVADEVWLFGGPYFGFYESTLTGPNSKLFWYNGGDNFASRCNKLVPIMGFNYERRLEEMIHDLGHRTESTLNKLYGTANMFSPSTNWDYYTKSRKSVWAGGSYNSPYGCGIFHYPPNTNSEYIMNDPTIVSSYCAAFNDYPDLSAKNTPQNISSAAWSSSEIGFYSWWFGHIPNKSGCNSDKRMNDWWAYIADPNMIYQTCTPTTIPTNTPTTKPTSTPTRTPTKMPTNTPTKTSTPTPTPTKKPNTPTSTPTKTPTNTPTTKPNAPTNTATKIPTNTPTQKPGVPSNTPTRTSTPTPTNKPGAPTNTPVAFTSTPTPTPTTVIPLEGVECGSIDTNGDNVLNMYDLIGFSQVYQKKCSDIAPRTGCGGKDTNSDTKVDIYDFIHFSKNYFSVKASCTLEI